MVNAALHNKHTHTHTRTHTHAHAHTHTHTRTHTHTHQALASNNLEKIAETMQQFEKSFENLDLQTQVGGGVTWAAKAPRRGGSACSLQLVPLAHATRLGRERRANGNKTASCPPCSPPTPTPTLKRAGGRGRHEPAGGGQHAAGRGVGAHAAGGGHSTRRRNLGGAGARARFLGAGRGLDRGSHIA